MDSQFESLFKEAYNFAFKEVYHMWKADLEKIFSIGTEKDKINKGGCNLATTILVIIGIESIARFFYYEYKGGKPVQEFVNTYFHDFYKDKFKDIYESYRHGLAHYAYPKMRGRETVSIMITQTHPECVSELERIKIGASLATLRKKQKINKQDARLTIHPQVLFLDAVEAIEKFKNDLLEDEDLKKSFVDNFLKIKEDLFK